MLIDFGDRKVCQDISMPRLQRRKGNQTLGRMIRGVDVKAAGFVKDFKAAKKAMHAIQIIAAEGAERLTTG